MTPAIEPGDWLLVRPLARRWPRVGSVVLFREPDDGELAVKRVEVGPGGRVAFAGGYLSLGPDEAWLTSDASPAAAEAAGFGPPIDSNRFGPVALEQLVGPVLFRYGRWRRIGRISSRGGNA